MHGMQLAWLLQQWRDLAVVAGWPEEHCAQLGVYAQEARLLAKDNTSSWAQEIGSEGFAVLYQEWLETGSLAEWEILRARVPVCTQELLQIPSVTPELARRLLVERSIHDKQQLLQAAEQREIQTMAGLEAKTERTILRELHGMEHAGEPVSLGIARATSEEVSRELLALPQVDRVEPAGQQRRFCAAVDQLSLVVQTEEPQATAKLFSHHPLFARADVEDAALRFGLYSGLQGVIDFVPAATFAAVWWQRTGSERHIAQVIERVEQGIHSDAKSETELYTLANLPFIVPELRNGSIEVNLAAQGRLPRILQMEDIRGDLHMHTDASDGRSSLEEMVAACRARGYEYMAICDHSQSLVHANGMSVERLLAQGREIAELRQKTGFPILRGVEVDILLDGTLDYDDALLADMDIVVASIHSGFEQSEREIMQRLWAAIRNPHVDFIGHPSGRLVCYRGPYAVDMDALLQACSDYGTALEINSAPERLDLDEHYARQAKQMRIPIVINTDAHHLDQLALMEYGVHYSRRAWLEPEDVVNCWSLQQVIEFCQRRQ